MLSSKLVSEQGIAKYALGSARNSPYAMEQDCDQAGFEVRILDVFRASQERDTDLHELFALCGGNNVWHPSCDELEVTDNVLDEVLRKAFERH
jgi:hypothetical protein